jgi:chromosome segregation ATPase
MKSNPLLLTLLAIGILSLGCNRRDTTSEQVTPVQAHTTPTPQSSTPVNTYNYSEKHVFTSHIETELAELNHEIDLLAARIDRSSDQVKTEASAKLQRLRDQSARLNEQLEEAKGSSESAWDDVKSGTKRSLDSLNESFQESRQWVSEKIAP